MTEVLLLLVALLLSLACGAFVAAEFSLTTVERGELERAVGARRAGRGGRPEGRTEPDLPALRRPARHHRHQPGRRHALRAVDRQADRGPAGGARASRARRASSLALVLGTALSTVFLMVVGELVPEELGDLLAAGRRQAGGAHAQRVFSAAFRPFISHLNNTANRIGAPLRPGAHRGAGLRARPAGAGRAGPALRQGGRAGGGHRRAVRPHAQPRRPDRGERDDARASRSSPWTCRPPAEDVANATRATGLSRFPVYRGSLDTVVGIAHIKDVLAVPAERRPRIPVVRADARAAARPGVADRRPAAGPAVRQAHHGRRHRRVRRHGGRGHAGGHRRGGRRRGAGRARPARDARPGPGGHGRRGPHAVLGRRRGPHRPARARSACGRRRGRTRRWPAWSRPSSAASRPWATRVRGRRLAARRGGRRGAPGRAGPAARAAAPAATGRPDGGGRR